MELPSFITKIFSRKKTNSEHALALDIGTEMVKALIFKIDATENKGIVLGVGKSKQRLGDMSGGAVSDIAGVIDTCEKAIIKAYDIQFAIFA
ncbi:MAG: hypothetical protein JRF56_10490 [Deltaproteobacteria bacterium]|jgi:cell division ATPase FtsA|nr:hypothetical protein [Deltaproteobacteria bacterium]